MKKLLKLGLILAGIILVGWLAYLIYQHYAPQFYALFHVDLNPNINRTYWIKQIQSHGFEDALLFTGMIAILTAIPGLPISVIAVFSGVGFGPFLGSVINLCGIALGNLLDIWLMRTFGLSKASQRSQKFVNGLSKRKHPLLALAIGYAVPVVPAIAVDMVVVKLNLKPKQMIPTIFAGAIPVSFLYAYGGDALLKQDFKRIVISVVGLVILVGLVVIVKREYDKTKALDPTKAT